MSSSATGFNLGVSSTLGLNDKAVKYICGDCNQDVLLKKGDAVRCSNCGYRVLYKPRTEK
jgi:DNA-directed RNA polymerase I, II, and III subunit RPABC4